MSTAKSEFRRIADEIAERIKSGELPPGTKLPTIAEIAEQNGVSAATAYRAVALLHDRELIRGYQGKGVFVAAPRT